MNVRIYLIADAIVLIVDKSMGFRKGGRESLPPWTLKFDVFLLNV